MRSGPHGRSCAVSKKRKAATRPALVLKMGATKWRVIIQDNPPNGEVPKDHYFHGYCDPVERIIWLNSNDDPETRLGTFLHELLHACEYMTGKNVGHSYIEGAANFMHQALEPVLSALTDKLTDRK